MKRYDNIDRLFHKFADYVLTSKENYEHAKNILCKALVKLEDCACPNEQVISMPSQIKISCKTTDSEIRAHEGVEVQDHLSLKRKGQPKRECNLLWRELSKPKMKRYFEP